MLYHSSTLTTELGREHRQSLQRAAERRRARRAFDPVPHRRSLAPPR